MNYSFDTWSENEMAVRYRNYKDMKKKYLYVAAGISHASMAKLGKNENVITNIFKRYD